MVALENHQLTLGLGDLGGEWTQHMTEHSLHLHAKFSTRCHRRAQVHLKELATGMIFTMKRGFRGKK